jgi:hypothetical protein
MNIIIEFSNPYQRFQVQNAMNNILVLPDAAVVEVRNESRYTELMLNVDASLDLIDCIKVSNFTDRVEVAQFINSIPNAAFTRISRLTLA